MVEQNTSPAEVSGETGVQPLPPSTENRGNPVMSDGTVSAPLVTLPKLCPQVYEIYKTAIFSSPAPYTLGAYIPFFPGLAGSTEAKALLSHDIYSDSEDLEDGSTLPDAWHGAVETVQAALNAIPARSRVLTPYSSCAAFVALSMLACVQKLEQNRVLVLSKAKAALASAQLAAQPASLPAVPASTTPPSAPETAAATAGAEQGTTTPRRAEPAPAQPIIPGVAAPFGGSGEGGQVGILEPSQPPPPPLAGLVAVEALAEQAEAIASGAPTAPAPGASQLGELGHNTALIAAMQPAIAGDATASTAAQARAAAALAEAVSSAAAAALARNVALSQSAEAHLSRTERWARRVESCEEILLEAAVAVVHTMTTVVPPSAWHPELVGLAPPRLPYMAITKGVYVAQRLLLSALDEFCTIGLPAILDGPRSTNWRATSVTLSSNMAPPASTAAGPTVSDPEVLRGCTAPTTSTAPAPATAEPAKQQKLAPPIDTCANAGDVEEDYVDPSTHLLPISKLKAKLDRYFDRATGLPRTNLDPLLPLFLGVGGPAHSDMNILAVASGPEEPIQRARKILRDAQKSGKECSLRHPLVLRVDTLRFLEHPLFGPEHVLAAKLWQVIRAHQKLINDDLPGMHSPKVLRERLSAAHAAQSGTGGSVSLSEFAPNISLDMRRSAMTAREYVSQLKEQLEASEDRAVALMSEIVELWRKLKSLQASQGWAASGVKILFHRTEGGDATTRYDEENDTYGSLSASRNELLNLRAYYTTQTNRITPPIVSATTTKAAVREELQRRSDVERVRYSVRVLVNDSIIGTTPPTTLSADFTLRIKEEFVVYLRAAPHSVEFRITAAPSALLARSRHLVSVFAPVPIGTTATMTTSTCTDLNQLEFSVLPNDRGGAVQYLYPGRGVREADPGGASHLVTDGVVVQGAVAYMVRWGAPDGHAVSAPPMSLRADSGAARVLHVFNSLGLGGDFHHLRNTIMSGKFDPMDPANVGVLDAMVNAYGNVLQSFGQIQDGSDPLVRMQAALLVEDYAVARGLGDSALAGPGGLLHSPRLQFSFIRGVLDRLGVHASTQTAFLTDSPETHLQAAAACSALDARRRTAGIDVNSAVTALRGPPPPPPPAHVIVDLPVVPTVSAFFEKLASIFRPMRLLAPLRRAVNAVYGVNKCVISCTVRSANHLPKRLAPSGTASCVDHDETRRWIARAAASSGAMIEDPDDRPHVHALGEDVQPLTSPEVIASGVPTSFLDVPAGPPCVYAEIIFRGERARTHTRTGVNPHWNSALEIPFEPPGGSFEPEVLSSVEDEITIALFDEIRVNTPREDDRAINITVTERRYIGSVSIPFSTVWLKKSLDGTYPLTLPDLNLGHEVCLHLEDASHSPSVAIVLSLKPLLPHPPDFVREPFSDEAPAMLNRVTVFQNKAAQALRKAGIRETRKFTVTVPSSVGGMILAPRYLSPLEPPPSYHHPLTLLRFISNVPYVEDAVFTHGSDAWDSAKTFLECGAGDCEEHSILLACYFMWLSRENTGLREDSSDTENSLLPPYDRIALVLAQSPDYFDTVVVVTTKKSEVVIWDAVKGQYYRMNDAVEAARCRFLGIHTVVTATNVYANIQAESGARYINWNLEDANFWMPFSTKGLGALRSVQPMSLQLSPPDYSLADFLTNHIRSYVVTEMPKWRRAATYFDSSIGEQLGSLLPYMEAFNSQTPIAATTAARIGLDADCIISKESLKTAQDIILRNALSVYEIIGFPLNFYWKDFQHLEKQLKMCAIYSLRTERFAIGTYVHAFPGKNFSVWLYLVGIRDHNATGAEVSPDMMI